jgi:thioredoxin reductase
MEHRMSGSSLPVVIIGAGPVGLAAAAQVLSRNLTPLVFEAGPSAGAGIRRWAHVRMFSPWKFNVDGTAAALLERQGWIRPDGEGYPTGGELVAQYLEPLAATPELAPQVRFHSRVVAVSRQDRDLMKDAGREGAPYVVRVSALDGEYEVVAQAVIDASGTFDTPGALGASGLPALGERAAADHIFYGIPDVLGTHRARYGGKRVLVVGSGHSALNALLDLARLAESADGTQIIWAIRRPALGALLGGARNDQLEERGKLGVQVRALLDSGRVELVTAFRLHAIKQTERGLIASDGSRNLAAVDEVIAATGFRPDWSIFGGGAPRPRSGRSEPARAGSAD